MELQANIDQCCFIEIHTDGPIILHTYVVHLTHPSNVHACKRALPQHPPFITQEKSTAYCIATMQCALRSTFNQPHAHTRTPKHYITGCVCVSSVNNTLHNRTVDIWVIFMIQPSLPPSWTGLLDWTTGLMNVIKIHFKNKNAYGPKRVQFNDIHESSSPVQ